MDTKVCKRCGREQALDQFRPYYGGRNGYYSFCRTCERIDQRRKYRVGKQDDLAPCEAEELRKIDELYERRRATGLKVPGTRAPSGVTSIVDAMLEDLNK